MAVSTIPVATKQQPGPSIGSGSECGLNLGSSARPPRRTSQSGTDLSRPPSALPGILFRSGTWACPWRNMRADVTEYARSKVPSNAHLEHSFPAEMLGIRCAYKEMVNGRKGMPS